MDDVFNDKRFRHLASDPRFRKVPRSERKVKIDHRFKAMFTDDKFKLKYAVDKRGRPVSQTQADNLKKYYELSSGEEASDDDDEEEESGEEQEAGDGESSEEEVGKFVAISRQKKKEAAEERTTPFKEEEPKEKRQPKKVKAGISADKVCKAPKEKTKRKKVKGRTYGDEGEGKPDESEQEDDHDGELEEEEASESDEDNIDTSTGKAGKDVSLGEHSDDEEQPQTSTALLKKEELRLRSKLVDQAHRERMKEEMSERLKDLTVDYARGIGTLGSEESSSDESTSEDSDDENLVHPWGELDKDAERTDEATSRFAACHLDWDRITAKDLFILFTSFLPPEGFVKSVVIYPSEFGLERMKEEELKGPKELVEEPKLHEFDEEEFKDKHADGAQFAMEKLREYQLNRLKYYYAVVSFDSAETANKVYTECDGTEYESSATKLDLRFIPEDMEFDQEPKDSCDSLPDVTKYKPRLFVNTALQQGTVRLTWDETDPNRVEFTRKIAGGGDANDDEVQAFVAAPSDSSGEEQGESEQEASEEEGKESAASDKASDPIAKYKALLSSVVADKKRKSNVDMEVSWGVGLGEEDSGNEMGPASDSEEEVTNTGKDGVKNRKMKKPGKEGKKARAKDDENEENAELQLLLADDAAEETSKAHFNFKDIQKEEKRKNKKRKHQKGKKEVEDNFEIDVNDSRFSALYTSHHFNIDPADPRFVKTSAAEKIIQEKQKRRRLNDNEEQEVKSTSNTQKMNPELASLVKSIKGKRSGT